MRKEVITLSDPGTEKLEKLAEGCRSLGCLLTIFVTIPIIILLLLFL